MKLPSFLLPNRSFIKLFVAITFSVICLSSCKRVGYSDLAIEPGIEVFLPPMEVIIDEPTLNQAYSLYSSTSTVTGQQQPLYGDGGFANIQGQQITRLDSRIQDAKVLLKEHIRSYMQSGNEDVGSLKIGISYSRHSVKKWGYLIPSTLTLGVLNLFGMTFFYNHTEVGLTCDLRNSKGTVVHSFEQLGEGAAKVALYSGYRGQIISGSNGLATQGTSAERMANIRALKQALIGLRDQFKTQEEDIRSSLN